MLVPVSIIITTDQRSIRPGTNLRLAIVAGWIVGVSLAIQSAHTAHTRATTFGGPFCTTSS